MNDSFTSQVLLCGKTRRKLQELELSVGTVEPFDKHRWSCKVKLTGFLKLEYEAKGITPFGALIIGLAALRQTLRAAQEENEKLKFYEVIGDETVVRSIEHIFWTYDCVDPELEDKAEWAMKNGYTPE